MEKDSAALKQPRPYAESDINRYEEKTPRYAWVIWIVTFLVSFAAPLGQFKLVNIPLYFIYVPNVSPAGGFMLDGAGFGMLMTCVSLIGIVLAFPAAFICRKLGLRWTITIATLGVIVGGLIPALAGTNITALYIGRFIEGLGIGLVGVSAPTLITLWFPDKTRGVMLGLWCCWVPLSITLDALVTPSIAAASGWQGVFWFVIIFATVALILFNIFYKVPGGEGASYNVESNFKECVVLLKNKDIWAALHRLRRVHRRADRHRQHLSGRRFCKRRSRRADGASPSKLRRWGFPSSPRSVWSRTPPAVPSPTGCR